jgi:hypothetical protein
MFPPAPPIALVKERVPGLGNHARIAGEIAAFESERYLLCDDGRIWRFDGRRGTRVWAPRLCKLIRRRAKRTGKRVHNA